MSKKSVKSVSVNAEIAQAAEAICNIKNESLTQITEQFLQEYIMKNMSVLVGKLNRLESKSELGKDA